MADRLLLNSAKISGVYNSNAFTNSPSSENTVRLVDPTFEKTADRTMWFSGELTYFLTINNTEGEGSITNISISDTLDITMFEYIENSVVVEINGTALPSTDFTAVYSEPTLTITITPDIPAGSIAVISFRGNKVAA